jgi:predicted Zn-dependent peptidase
MWDPYVNFEKIVLPNGLTIFASQVDREFEIFGFVIHAGAREDTFEKSGVAHFVEHCVSKNIPDWPKEKIRPYFQKQGGFANLGITDYLSTTYMCKCQAIKKNISTALDIFGKMLLGANISKDIEVERKIITQEYNLKFMHNIVPKLMLQSHSCVFPGHRLANYLGPSGNIDGIKGMDAENLQRFYDSFYVPANISVIAIGKISPESVAKFLEKSPLGISKSGQRNAVSIPRFPDYSALTRYDIKISLYLGTTNLMTRGEYRTEAALSGTLSPESVMFTKKFLENILFQEIREKRGWAYDVEIGCQTFQDLYRFVIRIPMKLEALSNIEKTVDNCIANALNNRKLFNLIWELDVSSSILADLSCEEICSNSMREVGNFNRIISNHEAVQMRKLITLANVEEVLTYLTPDKRLTIISYP